MKRSTRVLAQLKTLATGLSDFSFTLAKDLTHATLGCQPQRAPGGPGRLGATRQAKKRGLALADLHFI